MIKKVLYLIAASAALMLLSVNVSANVKPCSQCTYPDIILVAQNSVPKFSTFDQAIVKHYSFKGAYLGISGGLAMARSTLSINPYDSSDTEGSIGSDFFDAIHTAGSGHMNSNQLIAGLKTGYNWQRNHLVYGLELDASYLPVKQERTVTAKNPNHIGIPGAGATFIMDQSVQANWLLTLRPRIGVVVAERFLVYATGGLALTQLKKSSNYNDDYTYPGFISSPSNSKTVLGWTAGAGMEFLMTEKLSFSAEYLYVDFKGLSSNPTYTRILPDEPPSIYTTPFNNTAALQLNIIRAGITYHF